MDAIAVAMSFPSTFGRKLDALYDYLTDLLAPRGSTC